MEKSQKSSIPDDIEIVLHDAKDIPKQQKSLYTRHMTMLARKANQELYDRFKNTADIDFIPMYVYYDVMNKSMKLKCRKEFLDKYLEIEIDFAKWLRSKGMFKKAGKWEQYKQNEFAKKSPHLKDQKKQYIREMREQGKIHEFGRTINKDSKVSQSSTIMYSKKAEYLPKTQRTDKTIEVTQQQYNKPIKGADMLKLFDPENEDLIWGGSNFKSYVIGRGVNPKIYNKIMKETLALLWKEFEKVNVLELTEEGVAEFQESYLSRFPNIERVRDWFVNKGIYNTSSGHYYTLERFMNLKSNKARANFIDRAVFVISNSIYMKANNISPLTVRGKPRLNAGMKTSIKRAQKFKKISAERKKYSTERTKKYDEWRLDDRKIAANLKRKVTRSKRER